MDAKGITIRRSKYSAKETIDNLVTFLKDHGATIYARINQQSELHKAGIEIRPLEFLLFGNPKAGGQVIKENALAALELPLKIISWENNAGDVWIAYNQAIYLEDRFSISHELMAPMDLDALIAKAGIGA